MGGQDLDYGPLMADALSQTGGRDRRAAQIEQAKREWELVADSLPQLIFLIGHDTEVVRANRTLEWWGVGSVATVRGTQLHALLHPGCSDAQCYLGSFVRRFKSRATDEALTCEAQDRVLRRFLRLHLRPFPPTSNTPGSEPAVAVAVIEDVTEIKRVAEAQRRFQEELERSVRTRTAELVLANSSLQRLVAERERAEASLIESQSELRLLTAQLRTAQEKERSRIANELHDSVVQSLSAIKFGLERGLELLSDNDTRLAGIEAVTHAVPAVRDAIDEVRRISMDLRPSMLDDLGIVPTLAWFAREFQQVYGSIHLSCDCAIDETAVPDALKTPVFRIVQEAAGNVAEHARASRMRIALEMRGAILCLIVEDDGAGFDAESPPAREPEKRGLGLRSMRERAESTGGRFEVVSAPGRGTRIEASWPLRGNVTHLPGTARGAA